MPFIPVRLCDVHPHVLAAAARRIARQEPDKAIDVLAAAASPSSTTYWLPATAAQKVAMLTTTASDYVPSD